MQTEAHLSLSMSGSEVNAAIGTMKNSFNPNEVIQAFLDLGVDIAFMQGSSRVFIIAPHLFEEVFTVLDEANIPVKMRLNNAIAVIKNDCADMEEILEAFANAD